ncbi:MAG TPA: sigma 54-interacting transcriptional regulator [Polyangium sp.]|nr:sigma 54-interacting transcriptional regulator [Polyangium sp.]
MTMLARELSPPVLNSAKDLLRTETQAGRGRLRVPAVQIHISTPDGTTSVYDVNMAPIVLGSRSRCDVVIKDPHVSSEHCEIHVAEEGVVFRDKGSKNGSFLGTTRIIEGVLADNTTVRIGSTSLLIRSRGPREIQFWDSDSFHDVKGQSLLMRALFAQAARACAETGPILLIGERGTGRCAMAQAMAKEISTNVKFVIVDCAKLRRGHELATLFGHVEGDDTRPSELRHGILEKARGGLLLLANIDELSADVGGKLVLALRTQRIIPVGTNQQRPFAARVMISAKPDQINQFGIGEYVRAHGGAILHIPPLRHRKDDIPLLVEAFLAQCNPPRKKMDLPQSAWAFFRAHTWDYNVAELQKFVGLFLGVENVKQYLAEFSGDNNQRPNLGSLLPMKLADARQVVVDHFDRAYIKAKLHQYGGNVTQTADAIGVTRQYLSQLKREHGLSAEEDV